MSFETRLLIVVASSLVACGGMYGEDESTEPEPTLVAPAPATEDAEQSPEARHAVIRVHYPAGSRTLTIRGSNAPSEADSRVMSAKGDDVWELDLGPISQPFEFQPMLDGKPARGPRYVVRPGETADIYPWFDAIKGKVEVMWARWSSQVHPSTRAIRVYTPPSYAENTAARYPVLYVHDGQFAFRASPTAQSNAAGTMAIDDVMDEGIASGAIAEAIVVAIDNDSDLLTDINESKRLAELTPTPSRDYAGSGKGPSYAAMILHEIKPMVDARLRTRPDRENTFTIGASLGGLISAYLGLRHGDVFGAFGTQSGCVWWDRQWIVEQAKKALEGPNRPLRVYVDYGAHEVDEPAYTEKVVGPTEAFLEAFRKAGYTSGESLAFTVGSGNAKPTPPSFAKRLPGALAFLIGPGR